MTDVKMPEPVSREWTELEQLIIKQYGDDRAREALEKAAQVAEEWKRNPNGTFVIALLGSLAEKFRALAKEIK